eukprot:gene15603-32961_t
MFLDSFDAQLRPHIASLVEGDLVGKLEVSDMMELIDWLEYFVHQANVFDGVTDGNNNNNNNNSHDQTNEDTNSNTSTVVATRLSCQEYLTYQENLVLEYLDRIKSQVMEWFRNIKKQNRDVIKAADGTLITSTPEDMFNVIHMQLAVAKDKLPKEHIKDVVNACLQVLREVQRGTYDELAKEWDKSDPETLCSIVNDMQRLQEKAEEFSEK